MLTSVGLLGLAIRTIPLGTAYAVWVGVGTIGTAVVGILRFGDSSRPARLACLSVLVAALVGLHLTGCAPRPDVARSPANAASPHAMGVHGMVLFGRDRIYASHLPLYQPPHDSQVVLELDVVDAATRDAVLVDLRAGSLVTLEPEAFDLARLAPDSADPLRAFTGSIFRGHFERDGVLAHAQTAFRVREVLLFRRLSADAPASAPQWLAFGSPSETYLVHAIGGRPDADTILRVVGSPPARGVSMVPAESLASSPLPSPAWLASHGWQDARLVYREEGDLR